MAANTHTSNVTDGKTGGDLNEKGICSKEYSKTRYQVHNVIGKGGFGIVLSATRWEDNKPVAIKCTKTSGIRYWGEIDGYKVPLEFEILRKVSGHPNVIQMVEWFHTEDEYCLIMERPDPVFDVSCAVEGKEDGLPEYFARQVLRQIAGATLHCHNIGFIHKDIKCSNVIISPKTFEAKLIDFGVSRRLKNEPYTRSAGTRSYFPPEWFANRSYDGRKYDIWCLGTMLYELVEGRMPFEDAEGILKCELQYKSGGRVSDSCKDLIGSILKRNPEERPSIEEILEHPWFKLRP